MIYKAYLIQDSEGCDYSIACGEKVIDLEATSLDEAKQELIEVISEDYSFEEYRLKSAQIFQVSDIYNADIKSVYKKIDDDENAEEENEKENAERLEISLKINLVEALEIP